MNNKTISDVLEYLYKQDKKDLAQVVLDEINRKPEVIKEYIQQPTTIQPQEPGFKTPFTPPYYQTWC